MPWRAALAGLGKHPKASVAALMEGRCARHRTALQ